jgi:hypothetical protein
MNWDVLGVLAETVGAAGVIITLGYLAIQIRRSNVLALAESNRFSFTSSNATTLAIAQDPELARIFYEGLSNREVLSAQDRLRFDMLMGALIGGISTSITDQDILGHRGFEAGQDQNLREFLLSPGGASWWAAYRLRYKASQRLILEEILQSGGSSEAA